MLEVRFMSFATNSSQQISIFDATSNLTQREVKMLEKSWAKFFSENIFPAIDEEPFRVLYSDQPSRKNTPINVIMGALIIKEMFQLTDEEMVETLPFDIRYQYALHTTSLDLELDAVHMRKKPESILFINALLICLLRLLR